MFLSNRFNNIETIKNVSCPTLIIHGQKDKLIPYSHSFELSKNCGGPFDLVLPENMDHNEFNIYDDFFDPLCSFLKRHSLVSFGKTEIKVTIPRSLYEIPDYYDLKNELPGKDFVTHFIRKVLKI